MDNSYSVEMQDIVKSFGGVHALKGVSLQVKPGEVHALIGENGAGKSTLIKVLSGAVKCDSGSIIINGEEVKIHNPLDAIKKGVSVIYQELNLVSHLSVAENLFLGEDISLKKNIISWKNLNEKSRKVFEQIDFDIDPKAIVGDVSIAYQQMLEVAKAVSHDSAIIVFDEPTAVLSTVEAQKLFKVINDLKAKNKSIIYISHRLAEVFEISDRITIMKDGEIVGTYETSEINEGEAVNHMIGRSLEEYFPPKEFNIGETVLKVSNLNAGKMVRDVNFELKRGEIVGFSGLVGAGKTETMRAIFGADKIDGGDIFINGKKAVIKRPKDAIKQHTSYISENRKEEGIILDMSIRDNITMADLRSYTGFFGWIDKKKEEAKVSELIDQFGIKTPDGMQPVNSLSGGNQQKVSLAKWIALNNDIILFDEPTRGVDVGAKIEIYKIISEIAKNGIGIIIVSSEMMEVIGMCNRVIVMHEGRITGEFSGDEITEDNLISRALALA